MGLFHAVTKCPVCKIILAGRKKGVPINEIVREIFDSLELSRVTIYRHMKKIDEKPSIRRKYGRLIESVPLRLVPGNGAKNIGRKAKRRSSKKRD